MSFFDTLKQDVDAVETWMNTSTTGQMIEADFKACMAELEKIAVPVLQNCVTEIATAVLGSLAGGGTTAAAIDIGIMTAQNSFKAAGAQIASQAVNTLVTTVVNKVKANAPTA
jgi:hypothetical protein